MPAARVEEFILTNGLTIFGVSARMNSSTGTTDFLARLLL